MQCSHPSRNRGFFSRLSEYFYSTRNRKLEMPFNGRLLVSEIPVFSIAIEHGIKHVCWPDKLNEYTHFLLPFFNFDRYETLANFSNKFVEFWLRLSDIHKERRLLVSFMCGLRFIEEWKLKFLVNGKPQFCKDCVCCIAEPVKEIERECVSDCAWIMRRLFIEEQDDRRRLLYVFKQFSMVYGWGTKAKERFIKEFFDGPFETAGARAKSIEHATPSLVQSSTTYAIDSVFLGIHRLLEGWMAADRMTDSETAEQRKRYLSKLKAAAPHWRPQDRAYMLKAVETNGESCNGNYVQKLIEAVGVEYFKLIAFGKEKFCASCGQSSYTAKDRLLGCKRCVRERIRPKARYCNTDCQRAHWIQHKAEIHACSGCGRLAEVDQGRLRACMRCIEEKKPTPARYCDASCQKSDWKKHKASAHGKPKEMEA